MFLHRIYQGVLSSWVRLSFISIAVVIWACVAIPGGGVPLWAGVSAGAGLPVAVSSPPDGIMVGPPSVSCAGRGRDVLPLCRMVLLTCVGRRRVVACVAGCWLGLGGRLREWQSSRLTGSWRVLVVSGVWAWVSWHRSGVSGIIIWIPPETERWLSIRTFLELQLIIARIWTVGLPEGISKDSHT